MSNNKQSMKLYTEEQLKKAIELAQECEHDGYYPVHFDYSQTEILQHLTPIELPSDEEIEKQAEHEDTYSKKCAFTRGAKWMWRKTFGGNNEQQ